MQIYKISIDDTGYVHLNDEDGNVFTDENQRLNFLWKQLEITRIGKTLVSDDKFATDAELVTHIASIVENYFMEKEAFITENHYRILRLAILDAQEDLEI